MAWPPQGPLPTVDVLALAGEAPLSLVLVRRRNPPLGWALPGGFIDQGERAEDAALRELQEETGLTGRLLRLFGVYSDPARDPRRHTLTVVYLARAEGRPEGADDAAEARIFPEDELRRLARGEALVDGLGMAFDHARILQDFFDLWPSPQAAPPRPSSGASSGP